MEKEPIEHQTGEPQPIESEIAAWELIEVFKDFLNEDDTEFLCDPQVDSFEAINYLFGVLPERGVADPGAVLAEKGLLEPPEHEAQ